MSIAFDYDEDRIQLSVDPARQRMVARLFRSTRGSQSISAVAAKDRRFAFALADLRALATASGELDVTDTRIRMTHALASRLDAAAAEALGLPPRVELVLHTDVEGQLGSPSFRLRYEWLKDGRTQRPRRTGAILDTRAGARLLPHWLLSALEVADAFEPGEELEAHWEALARFRDALEPGDGNLNFSQSSQVAMARFLKGLNVQIADRFSISPSGSDDALDFDPVPFFGEHLDANLISQELVKEADGEIAGARLANFQRRFRHRGSQPAYRTDRNSYLVVDRSAAPVIEVMAKMQRAPAPERHAFIRNPLPAISNAVEASLEASGGLQNLTALEQEEAIERASECLFLETQEYSERVTGIGPYTSPDIDKLIDDRSTWLPESFEDRVVDELRDMDADQLSELLNEAEVALESGEDRHILVAGVSLPATPDVVSAIKRIHAKATPISDGETEATEPREERSPIIAITKDNIDSLGWRPARDARRPTAGEALPAAIRTTLKLHQVEAFKWKVKAWRSGLPGVLNADEQGLGKTLQTIAFLRWLQHHMNEPEAELHCPLLVVAPTSLLQTWQQEVDRHVSSPGLGSCIELYGAGLGRRKMPGKKGRDIDSGEQKLDLRMLHEAIRNGRGQRFWVLTTYSTLTNYQHSLATIEFGATVFDEIQALKNPGTLRSAAARAINADFRIGLTGTPIENASADLWAVMDQLCAGSLGTLQDFNAAYRMPDEVNMGELHRRVFEPQGSLPAIAMRRTKERVAPYLPAKIRRLHPRPMPPVQAKAYENARLALAEAGGNTRLKVMHRIRTVSAHPSMALTVSDATFVEDSARLDAAFRVLRRVADSGERALVFIEHRRLQQRFVEVARHEFGLDRVDLINGNTPIRQRQAIVDRFQRHLKQDGGFDLLALGPRAAGTGLTLTAATHVVHISRWWNPAVEEQCNDRVHRIGQDRPVTIHVPMAIHPEYRELSFDCVLHELMCRKRKLASAALWPMGDTGTDVEELERRLSRQAKSCTQDPVASAMQVLFGRIGEPLPEFEIDGSLKAT